MNEYNVISFGSCMSANIAYELFNNFNFNILSVSRSVRIDSYVHRYILQKEPQITEEMYAQICSSIIKNEKYKFVLRNIKNQIDFISDGMGKAYDWNNTNCINLEDALNSSKKKIIIFDNYSEIIMKLYKFSNGSKLFLDKKWFDNFNLECVLEDYISFNDLEILYITFIEHVKKQYPETIFIFIEFPFQYSKSENIKRRAKEFNNYFLRSGLLKSLGVYTMESQTPDQAFSVHPHWSNFMPIYYKTIAYNAIYYIYGTHLFPSKISFAGGVMSKSIMTRIVDKSRDFTKIHMGMMNIPINLIVERDIWNEIEYIKEDDVTDENKHYFKSQGRLKKLATSEIVLLDIETELNLSEEQFSKERLLAYLKITFEYLLKINADLLIFIAFSPFKIGVKSNNMLKKRWVIKELIKEPKINILLPSTDISMSRHVDINVKSIIGYYQSKIYVES